MISRLLKNKKVRKMIGTITVSAVALCGVMGVSKVSAADITSGNWCVYYNSPGSYATGDYVLLTAYAKTTYSAKCSTLNNNNLAVDFTDNDIYAAGDGSLIFTKTGTKRFKFNSSLDQKNVYVNFTLKRSGNATGLARGGAQIGTY